LLQLPGGSRIQQHKASAFATEKGPADEEIEEPVPEAVALVDERDPTGEPEHKKSPGEALIDDDDEAPLAEPAPSTTKRPDWGSLLQEEDSRQQDELSESYQQMLNMDDPEQVDKATKAAWARMRQEDMQFTGRMQHTSKKHRKASVTSAPATALAQRSDRLFEAFGSERLADEATHPKLRKKHRQRLMLNQRSATLRRKAEAPASKPTAASAPPMDLRSAPVAAALPLDAEAAAAQDADF
jgi:hypothetical protein